MEISVIGAGYVGLISSVGWAGLGHHVACIDTDAAKVAKINSGEAPFYEDGLAERLGRALSSGLLRASTDYSLISKSDAILIAVGTPSRQDGSMDAGQIMSAAESIARNLPGHFSAIVVRSTVLPGTTEQIVAATIEKISGKEAGKDFGVAMVPEFLKEGSAMHDFDFPDRIVIGATDDRTRQAMGILHKQFSCPKLVVGIKTAEMIKYASNSFLAAKISFANEIAGVCEQLGLDVDEVMAGAGLDSRIGRHFLVAGAGFGGSCFPKDVRALICKSKEAGASPILMEAVVEVNRRQQLKLVSMIQKRLPAVSGKKIAVLGLTFKPGTDDVRESPAIPLIGGLLGLGAHVCAYDPKGIGGMRKIFPDIEYADSFGKCLADCDAAVLVTAWHEFIKPAGEYKKQMGLSPLFDARRTIPEGEARRAGLEYHCIGRG